MMFIGATGAGTSHFGHALTEDQARFQVADAMEAGTIEPTAFSYELSQEWASKVAWPNGKELNPAHFVWHITDTPGIDDANGNLADERHFAKIAQPLTRVKYH
jgi:hypothetical protein